MILPVVVKQVGTPALGLGSLLWTSLLSWMLLVLPILCVHTWNTPFTYLDTTPKAKLQRNASTDSVRDPSSRADLPPKADPAALTQSSALALGSPGDRLGLLFSKDVNPGVSFALLCAHRCNHTPVATSFKLVKTSPMLGKVHRLEKVYVY